LIAHAPEVCIHLASAVGGFLYNLSQSQLPAIQAAIDDTVVELCHACSCWRLVFTSTINVFEASSTFHHGRLHALDQRSPYAVAKAAAERRLAAAFEHFTVVRPTNIYGKHQARCHSAYGESHVIPDLLDKLEGTGELEVLGDGTQRRNFVHVSDVCSFIANQLDSRGTHYLNLRSELSLSIGDLAQQLVALRDPLRALRFRKDFMRHELFKLPDFDSSPAAEQGWAPRIHSLAEGLSR
jgi:UDP-glucose 4-epimerase